MIKTILAKFSGLRLYLEYALIAAVIAMTALAWGYRLQAKAALNRNHELAVQLSAASTANAINQQTIKDLQEQRRRDSEALAGLAEDVAYIRRTTGATHSAVKNLGATNEAVNDYLQQPVPDDLRGLLNDRNPRPD